MVAPLCYNPPMHYRDPHERFWEKVHKTKGCWLWVAGTKKSNGGRYGQFSLPRHSGSIVAHRWAWEETNGPIPKGKQLDHLCRNTLCVNPDHLEPVTVRENILRGTNTAANHARKTHCLHGHPFKGKDFYIAASGQRMCRVCVENGSVNGRPGFALVSIMDQIPIP